MSNCRSRRLRLAPSDKRIAISLRRTEVRARRRCVRETILKVAQLLVPGALREKAGVDAVHIAAAAVEECDFLLTWNFRHIAKVRIRREVERILANHGYSKTTICTPEELF